MNTFEELKKFVVDQRWEYPFELKKTTRLYEDLKLYGDDAVDFFVAFGVKFNVDLKNFHLDLFFKGEGFSVLPSQNRELRKSISQEDLETAVEKGYLDGHFHLKHQDKLHQGLQECLVSI